jgi:glyoxylase-like metal-dependent hydrolase (beta-lactamase superfamily II)
MTQIIPLSEGTFTVDTTKHFIPFDTAHDKLQERSRGSLLIEIQPFLVITPWDYILLDTGLGFKNKNDVLQLHQHLIDRGVNPMEITKVLMSHLHKDHAGGVSVADELTGNIELSFPHATYYVNRQEMQYAIDNDGKSYEAKELKILQEKDNVVFVEGDGVIDDYIHYELTGGHCPYHQVFLIEVGEDKIFFGGDVAPQFSQMKSRFIAKYDYDGRRSMELRQEFAERGKKEGWIFLYYHDIKLPYGRWPD